MTAVLVVCGAMDSTALAEFSRVNVQLADGSGATSSVNGTGNLVLGYDESPGTQTGSHDLILGEDLSYTGYGDVVAGYNSHATGSYSAAFGVHATASGSYALVAGDDNTASGR